MNTPLFYAKWLFRVGHVLPAAAITGKVFFEFLCQGSTEPANGEKGLEIAFDVTLIICGLINMILLRPKSTFPTGLQPWKYALYVKLAVTIFLLTPFLSSVSSISKKSLNALQFSLLILIFIGSAFLRFFREHHTKVSAQQLI